MKLDEWVNFTLLQFNVNEIRTVKVGGSYQRDDSWLQTLHHEVTEQVVHQHQVPNLGCRELKSGDPIQMTNLEYSSGYRNVTFNGFPGLDFWSQVLEKVCHCSINRSSATPCGSILTSLCLVASVNSQSPALKQISKARSIADGREHFSNNRSREYDFAIDGKE